MKFRAPAFTVAIAIAVAASSFATTTAHAQPPVETPSGATNDEASKLFKKGNDAYKLKRWDEAETAFEEAWALKRSYDIAGNLGDVEMYLAKYQEAAEHLEYSLRNWPAGQEASRARTAERFEEAKKQVGTLTLKVTKGAEISINGKAVGKSPLSGPVFVTPGAATVIVTLGAKSEKKTVALDIGEAREIEIAIAGEAAAVGPVGPGAAAPGSGSGSGDGDVKPPSGSSVRKIGMIASGAVAVIGLAVGVGFYLMKQSAKDDADAIRSDNKLGNSGCAAGGSNVCVDLSDANDRAKSNGTISNIGFIGAGVGAAGYVAFMLMPKSKTSAMLHPILTPHTAGVGAFGRF